MPRPDRPPRTPSARLRTAGLLCQLLREDPTYRRRWARHTHQRGRGVHQGAVTHVLAEHLWSTGAESCDNRALPRQLKDVVSRALSGRTLSPRVLTLFVLAFEMGEDTSAQLHELLSGRAAPARPARWVSAAGHLR